MGFGKKGFGIGNLITAAIVALVVLFTVPIVKEKAVDAAENVFEFLGLDIGDTKIRSFSATPTEDGNMIFQLLIRGNKNSAELGIYQSYEPTPAKEPGDVDFKKGTKVYEVFSDKSPRLIEKVNKANKVLPVMCPADGGSEGCSEDLGKYEPGWYRFSAVMKKKGKSKPVSVANKVLGFYTEKYVESLNVPVYNCKDKFFGDCNVISCKATVINYDFFKPLGSFKEVAQRVSDEFRAERGLSEPNNCGKLSYPNFVIGGCSFEDIDYLNIKAVSLKFAQAKARYLADYEAGFLTLDDLKRHAIGSTMSCTEPWNFGAATVPVGAIKALNGLGWVRIGKFGEQEKKVRAELLRSAEPEITKLEAEVKDDESIVLSWNVALGTTRVAGGSYKIVHSYNQWVGSSTGDNFVDEKVLPGSIGEVLTSGFSTASGQPLGRHGFEIRVFESPGATGSELFTTTTSAGMFDDGYIETYNGGIEGCKTKLLPDSGFEDCNVDAQKRKEMKTSVKPRDEEMEKQGRIRAAYAKSSVNKELCKYEKGLTTYGFSAKCTPEEIDEVYHNFIDMIQPDDYYCKTPFEFGHFEAGHVCAVKRQVVTTLTEKGWNDLRVNKGWEANV